jgi:aromatic-amino-acid transaminase
MFSHLEQFAGDPILGINSLFHADGRSTKVNLSVGIYLDEAGRVPLLPTVQEAERRLLEQATGKPYLPIEGTAAMRSATAKLLFGEASAVLRDARVVTVQTVGSSGALKVAADFIRRWFPDSQAWVSSPTWENHRAILEGSGVSVHNHPYFDPRTGGLDFAAMQAALERIPRHGVVVLHGCCHNPTGVDLSTTEWDELVKLIVRKELLPVVDLAYQGFAEGLDEDARPLRALADAGVSFLVACSFSKNMSIYGERAGALAVVCPSRAQAELVFGQLQAIIRRSWSNPPMHANRIVDVILNDPHLRARWAVEVTQMRERIRSMRGQLQHELCQRNLSRSFDYLKTQRGMFSYTGLSPEQVQELREQWGVYLVGSGRICVAALNSGNVAYVARAITAVL